jgi:hypothetical protein
MSKSVTANMFDSIKSALEKPESSAGGLYREILKTPPENTFIVKLLPYAPKPAETFYRYYNLGWTSLTTGQYVQALSPATYGERDPINEARYAAQRGSDESLKEKFSGVYRSEKWLINVYVIDDPQNPENNGKVKILRAGKQLKKVIDAAITGEDADEFGSRVFDLSPDGVNLKLKVEKQGDYPTYTSSRFAAVNALDLSDAEQEKILGECFDLTEVFQSKTFDELTAMMNEHILGKTEATTLPESEVDSTISNIASNNVPVNMVDPAPQANSVPSDEPVAQLSVDEVTEDEIDSLLDGIEV